MTLQIYLQFWKDILSLWWPVVLFITVGLAYIHCDEKRRGFKVIKGMVVNKEELLKEIKEIRTELWRLNAIGADERLTDLQRRLSVEFEGEQKEFQLYDEVRIISVDRDPEATYPGEFLYEVGRITHVDRSVNYPYIVEIDGMKHSTSWLWKAEDLRLIERV